MTKEIVNNTTIYHRSSFVCAKAYLTNLKVLEYSLYYLYWWIL